MLRNVGTIDRILRLLLAATLLYLGLIVYGGSTLGLGMVITSAVSALTAIFGFCPLYRLLGIQTDRPQSQ